MCTLYDYNVTIDAGIYKAEVNIQDSGTWSAIFTIGDRDGDGVVDDRDECPDEPGSPYFNGCCSGSLLLSIFLLVGPFLIRARNHLVA